MRTFKSDFDFGKVKEHIATLSTTKEKIKYLMEQKAEYIQARTWVDWDKAILPFDKQCELEIKTLNAILALDVPPVQTKVDAPLEHPIIEKPTIENNPIKWSGTAGQLVYLFEQLSGGNFLPADIDLHATVKAHFVNSDGKTFTGLKQTKQDYLNSKTGKPKRAKEIESLVNKAKEKK